MPILARAVYDFEGAQADDLSFKEDDIIEVTDKDESGWWTGKVDGREGDFPFNYVTLLSEAETQEYLSQSGDKAGGASKDDADAQEDVVAFSGDKVDTLKVTGIAKEKGKNGGIAHIVEASTKSGKQEKSEKTVAEFRELDSQLRTILPNFEGHLPPAWADNAPLTEGAAKRRMEALEEYCERLLQSDGVEFLLVPWLFPGQGVDLNQESFAMAAKAQERAKEISKSKAPEAPPKLARVLFTWEPQDRVELEMHEGEVIGILSETTGSEGWWEGQSADGSRGLFPSNHVEVMESPEAVAWMSGDEKMAISKEERAAQEAAKEEEKKKKKKKKEKAASQPKKRRIIQKFTLNSLQAFDDLVDKGFCVEGKDGAPAPKISGDVPQPGDSVSLTYTCFVWDSQQQCVGEIFSSDDPEEEPLEFTVTKEGEEGDPQVIKAIQACVRYMNKGMQVRLTVAPSMGYGAAGVPPKIPPLSHLVYDLKLESFGEKQQQQQQKQQQEQQQERQRKPSVGMGSFFKSSSSASKPEVKPRITSARQKPVGDRKDKPPPPPELAAQPVVNGTNSEIASPPLRKPSEMMNTAAAASAMAVPSGNTRQGKEPTRRAGHIMVNREAPKEAAAPQPKVELKKYDLETLKKMVAEGADFASMQMNRYQLEDHLQEEDFEKAFEMDRTQFLLKPRWRQQVLKRAAGLF